MSDRNSELKKEVLYYAKLMDEKGMVNTLAVSYTHLTLPTKRIVEISVVAASLKKKTDNKRIASDD